MGLANYSELQATVQDYLAQDDLNTHVADFIRLAESRFDRELRIREMDRIKQGTIAADVEPLPADFVEAKTWSVQSTPPVKGKYRPPDTFFNLMASWNQVGAPRHYTILGTNSHWAPAPDSPTEYPYNLYYVSTVPKLTVTATTNYLLTKAPDLYLYASLIEAQPFVQDDARLQTWISMYKTALSSLHAADARARYRPGGLMRTEGAPNDGKQYQA